MAYECPLCGTDFEHAECRHGCPMSRGCAMVRCPRCGYEFVESGKFADMLRRWIRRSPAPPPTPAPAPETSDVRRLTDLDPGTTASIAFIAPTSSARINKLASFGLVPGSEIRLVSRRPAVVLQCGATSIAVEDEIGREIFVRVSAA
jgi:Fe2+ transport system protein FeoA